MLDNCSSSTDKLRKNSFFDEKGRDFNPDLFGLGQKADKISDRIITSDIFSYRLWIPICHLDKAFIGFHYPF